MNKLKQRFNINSRYKECFEMLDFYKIDKIRYQNDRDYCQIRRFYVRIHQPSSIKLLRTNTITKSAPYVSFKYLKSNDVSNA